MARAIKLKNDTYISRDSIGKTIFTGSLKIGETITVNNLSKYKYLEFFYGRGNDYGQDSKLVNAVERKHTCLTIIYVNDGITSFAKHTAGIYWDTTNNTVEFRYVINESSNGSNSFTRTANNYDTITKIVGYN